MSKKLLLPVIILFLIVTPNASAIDFDYNVMPLEGLSTQQILILIRSKPIESSETQYLYLFWDNIPIISRQADITNKNGIHTHRWDITFTPPKTANSYGKHRISMWVETEFGLIEKELYQYEILDGIPNLSTWESYIKDHPEVLAQITGPMGPIGKTGAPGEAGERGARGVQGDPGIIGLQGDVGETGQRGPIGATGENGSFSVTQVFFVCILSTIVTIGVLYGLLEIGLLSTVLEAKLRINDEK